MSGEAEHNKYSAEPDSTLIQPLSKMETVMNKASVVTFVFALLFVSCVFADERSERSEQSRRKLAEDVLLTMKVDKQVDDAYGRMKTIRNEQMKNMGASEDVMAAQDKMMDVMAQEMSWNHLRDDYISVYAQTFSEEDLKGLADFYKSPLGQKLVDKTPELTTKLMEISQKKVQQLMPQMKEMSNQMMEEIKKKEAIKSPAAETPVPKTK